MIYLFCMNAELFEFLVVKKSKNIPGVAISVSA